MKKLATNVTNGRNGGIHSARALHRITSMLLDHDFTSPRLYHLELIDKVFEADKPNRLLKMVKRITRHLQTKNLRYRWRACFEKDEAKSYHLHVFFFVEDGCINPDSIFNSTATEWLRKTTVRHGIRCVINPPKNSIHWSKNGKQKNYALTSTVEKLSDCINWLSYLAKSRSKLDSGQNYFSSKDSITSPILSPEPIQDTESPLIQQEEVTEQSTQEQMISQAHEDEPNQEAYQRESEADQSPESFNEITGEFIKLPGNLSIACCNQRPGRT